jgi:hypothetical protein
MQTSDDAVPTETLRQTLRRRGLPEDFHCRWCLGNLARTQHPHLIADDLGIDELAHLALKALEKLRR